MQFMLSALSSYKLVYHIIQLLFIKCTQLVKHISFTNNVGVLSILSSVVPGNLWEGAWLCEVSERASDDYLLCYIFYWKQFFYYKLTCFVTLCTFYHYELKCNNKLDSYNKYVHLHKAQTRSLMEVTSGQQHSIGKQTQN